MIWSSKLFSPQVKIIRVSLGAAQILVGVLSFQAGWCIYNLYFPAVLSQGGLARCLLMCIFRRLDDQRVIGAVGEGTESMGGAGRRLITNLRWRHDIAPARYISKTPSPFQRHTTVQYWFTCNCAWVHGAENVKKKVKQTVCDRWQEFWSWWAGTWTKQESHY